MESRDEEENGVQGHIQSASESGMGIGMPRKLQNNQKSISTHKIEID